MANETPVILLAFANARGDLHTLRDEQRELQELFETLQRSGHCRLVFRPDITLEQLYKALQEDRERLVLFHYGGHSREDRLMFDSGTGESPAFAGGLATLLGQCRGLKVVFLNGCSTGPQVKALLDAGVPAVIATARPIRDAVARDLAVAFYKALTTGDKECRIDRGQNLVGAFEAAKGFVSTADGANRSSLLDVGRELGGEDVSDLVGMPWDLYPSEPPISVARWTLFDKDPYFGLPGIPEDIPLPPKPFIHLEHFQREHAPVFFGRGAAIRVLYDLIRSPASPRVILYYGPTGVGKSSVLDAGLLPRIERSHEVVYRRRDESRGLLGTLRRAIGGDEERPLIELWTERETMTGRPLVVVVDQAEEAFTRPIAIVPEGNEEDALKRSWTDPDAELRGFAMALRELLGSAARPKGQVIVAFRNERLQEVRAAFDGVLLKVAEVPLAPLGRQELIEIIQKPCAMTRYNLSVEEGLADHIADELVKNGEAREAVAPTLQVLLSRMYAEFPNDPLISRPFSFELYRHLKTSGLLLRDFLDLGLKALSALGQEEGDAVRSGQVLEVLMEYTTEWGTAKALRQEDLKERFPENQSGAVSRLADQLEGLYLLCRPAQSAGQLALAHDTLAPVVRHAHQLSIAPAQRARRLLENKLPEWKDGAEGTVLDATQLAAVEEGLSPMRRMMPDEERLVIASREQEERRLGEESERKRRIEEAERAARDAEEGQLRFFRRAAVVLAGAFAVALFAVGVAVVQRNSAHKSAKLAEENRQQAERDARIAQLRLEHSALVQADELSRGDPLGAQAILDDENTFPIFDRDFAWGYYRGLVAWVRSFDAHQGPVFSVAFSGDGKTVATGGLDGKLRLWEAATGLARGQPIQAHQGIVFSVALSGDGKTVATGGEDGKLRLWEAATGQPRGQPIPTHQGAVNSVAFSGDGKTVATGGEDGKLWLWEAATGRPRGQPIDAHQGAVRSVAFSGEGKMVATGGDDGKLRLMEAATGQPRGQPIDAHQGAVRSVAFSGDGKMVATGGSDGKLRLWEAATGHPRGQPIPAHQGIVFSVAFSGDGKTVATGGLDGKLRLWEAATGQPRGQPIPTHQGTIISVAFSGDGKTVTTGGSDGKLRLWEAATRQPGGQAIPTHRGPVNSVAFSGDGKTVATGGADGELRLWEAATGLPRGQPIDTHQGVNSVAFSGDGKTVATRGSDGTLWLWEAATGLPRGQPFPALQGVVAALAFSNDGNTVATGGEDGKLWLWEAATGQPRGQPIDAHQGAVRSVAFSGDGKMVATGGDDGKLRLSEAATGQPRGQPIPAHQGTVYSVAFSGDGKTVATAGSYGTLRLWEAATGLPRGQPIPAHQGPVYSVAFSGDRKTVATAGADGKLRLWEAATGQPRGQPIDTHQGGVTSVAFSGDGKTLATAGGDEALRLWKAAVYSNANRSSPAP